MKIISVDVQNSLRFRRFAGMGLFFILVCSSGVYYKRNIQYSVPELAVEKEESGELKKYNIVILVSDGVNAEKTSVYGYERDTTPFLRKNKDRFTVFERAYANSSVSSSSVASLFTGRLPFSSGLIYFPDMLGDPDAYVHLPRLFREQGYHSACISTRTQTDDLDLGFKKGFIYSNGRSWSNYYLLNILYKNPLDHSFYLRMYERIVPRLLHLMFFDTMYNHFRTITEAELMFGSDKKKIDKTISHIEYALAEERPFFVYTHLMGTHGPYFFPEKHVFSKGKEDVEDLMDPDLYDDSILTFDQRVKFVYDFLESKGLLENTIFIITSDHGMSGAYTDIPLIMSLPDELVIPYTKAPVQLLDIAPTIVNAVGLKIPEWMEGDSLFHDLSIERKIFFVSHVEGHNFDRSRSPLRRFGFIRCNQKFTLGIDPSEMIEEKIPGVPECEQALGHVEARSILEALLSQSRLKLM
jgi:arylsulfatase A-like enzyme